MSDYTHLDVTNGDGSVTSDSTCLALGWAGVYLYGAINDPTRSADFVAKATALLKKAADALLTKQITAAPSGASYGSFRPTASFVAFTTEEVSVCGLCLLYAYRVLGTARYLTAARRAVTNLRRLQLGDQLDTTNAGPYSVSNAKGGTSRWHSGMWTHSVIPGNRASGPSAGG